MAEDSPFAGVAPFLKLLGRSFEEGDTTKYSRSDVLRTLIAPLGGTAAIMPALLWAKAPALIIEGDGAIFALFAAAYLAIYLYCFVKRPDSLRSETFELTKYAIEHHLFGDNTTGLIEGAPVREIREAGSATLSDASGGPK